jgi:predicted Zn-dependent peptidase
MMFKGSDNVGPGEHFFLVFNYGGSMNGTTNTDRTLYFEVMPRNQLDLGLFLESIACARSPSRRRTWTTSAGGAGGTAAAPRQPAVRQEPGALQRAGLRQPAYHHSVIGSMEDLNAATVDDVASFFRTYYAPNNAVVAIVGDVDAKARSPRSRSTFGDIGRPTDPAAVDPVGARDEGGASRDDARTGWRACR